MDAGTIFTVFIGVAFAGLIGFVFGCVYSDAHWQPIVREYKKAIVEYRKILKLDVEE